MVQDLAVLHGFRDVLAHDLGVAPLSGSKSSLDFEVLRRFRDEKVVVQS